MVTYVVNSTVCAVLVFFSKFWWHNIYTPEPRFSLSSKQQAADFWGHCLSPKGSCNASLERSFECLPIFYYIYLLCVCAHMYMSLHVSQGMNGDQRTVYRSSPLPSCKTWQIKLSCSVGLAKTSCHRCLSVLNSRYHGTNLTC